MGNPDVDNVRLNVFSKTDEWKWNGDILGTCDEDSLGLQRGVIGKK